MPPKSPSHPTRDREEGQPLLPANVSDGRSRTRRTRDTALSFGGVLAVLLLITVLCTVVVKRDEANRAPKDVPNYTKLPGPKPGLRNPSYFVSGNHGAVATEEVRCSHLGLQILKENGTAVDAAIASALCVGIVNSFSSGIGGGGFMVIRPPTCTSLADPAMNAPCKPPIAIDFRETAPTGAFPEMFAKSPLLSRIGGLAIGVPGELRGFEEAHKRYGGGVTWERIFEAAATLAEEFDTGAELARRLFLYASWMMKEPQWAKMFFPSGKAPKRGDPIYRPALAKTLRQLGSKGAGAFYKGEIADAIVATVQNAGGLMTKHDLASYRARVTPATVGVYRGKTYYTVPAPSSGPVLTHLLNLLEGYDTAEEGRTGLMTHRFVEALKFSAARRTEVGDPDFMEPEAVRRLAEMQKKSFAQKTRADITDNRTHHLSYYHPQFDIKEDHGTTHLSVVDRWGCAVSLSTTINTFWGSRVMDDKTGIIFNNEHDDFNTPNMPNSWGLRPSPYNYPLEGKRPLSSMAPVIFDAHDGNFWLALGGSGGSHIFGAIAQTLLGLDYGYDLGHAIEEPRLHDQLLPAMVWTESGYRSDLLDALTERGHNITLFDINIGIAEVQAVMRNVNGRIFGASDSRKNGIPAAY